MSMLSNRTLIRLSGEGVTEFLQGLVTSDVAGETPVWAGLLTPQGKCLFDFFVWKDGADYLLDVEADAAEDLAKRLTLYRLRRPITIALDDSQAVHWSPDGDRGSADPRHPDMGRRWLGEPSEAASGYDAHRLNLGICEGRAELADLLWLETNAAELNGVSFKKGCFVGQENTARMNWRGKVNRRLFVVQGAHEKAKLHHPDLDLSIVHARKDAVPDGALMPAWLKDALAG